MTLYMCLFIETLITVHTFIYSLIKCIFKTKMMVSNYNEIYLSFQSRVPKFCFTIKQIYICCFCSVTQPCLTHCNPKNGSMPGFPVLHYLPELLKLMSTELVIPSNHLISVAPFSSYPQSFPASGYFCSELTLQTRWLKYWSFSFSISTSNEYSGLISFRIDWFDLLAVFSNNTDQKHQYFGAQPSL